MEENMSDDDGSKRNNADKSDDTQADNAKAKRLKRDDGRSKEESSSSSNTTEMESAGTSTDSGVRDLGKGAASNSIDNLFPLGKYFKKRNYRRSKGDDDSSQESAAEEEEEVEEVEEEEVAEDMDDTHSAESLGIGSSDVGSLASSIPLAESDSDSQNSDCLVLKKPIPKHNWFIIPELSQRQIGYSAKLQSRELFMRRCYGSLRNVQRLELMYKMEEHDGCVNSLNFHHDGTLLASGSDDQKIVVWDWKIGKSLLSYKTKHKNNVFQSKFLHLSGDLHIASCARDGQVRIAQVSQEEGVRDNRLLGAHRGACHKLIVLPDQPHSVLSAGEDGIVLNHDVRVAKSYEIVHVEEDGRDVALYSIHGHPLKSNEFCVSGRDEIVRVYDQRSSDTPVAIYSPFKKCGSKDPVGYHVTCAVYNHDGSEILASYSDADIYLFDTKAPHGSYLHKYHGHRNGATIKGVNFFGPKSEFIISGSDCGHIYFWERNSEAICQFLLADDSGVVNCLEPHPQLPFLCTSGLDWDIKVWVPSCEKEPPMTDLAKTIKNNSKSRTSWIENDGSSESQMLWMLWRHLRTSRSRVVRAMTYSTSNSSSTNSDTGSNEDNNDDDDDDDEDGLDGPPSCTTS